MRPFRESIAKSAFILTLVLWARTLRADKSAVVQPLAFNDQLHLKPLLDMLDHGIASVEADIFGGTIKARGTQTP